MENSTNVEQKPKSRLAASIVLVVAVLAVGFFLLRGTTPPAKQQNNSENPFAQVNIMPVGPEDHILGDPNAKIIIVEYSDTECPFCKRFHGDMHKLLDSNSDVAWVYRHFPIPSLHALAFNESLATECAAEQGGNDTFWRYTDEVYNRTNSNDSLNPNELYNIAEDLDLNMLDFRTCLESQKYASVVEAHMADGSANGVQGTPTSFVLKEGKVVQVIPGALPYAQLSALVNELLQE